MKKKLFGLLPLLFLVGCVQNKVNAPVQGGLEQDEYTLTYDNELPVIHRDGSGVVTYLMLSKYGRAMVNGTYVAGVSIGEPYYYENCVAYEAAVGSELPVAVSTVDDVVFRGWYYYDNNIYPKEVTKVPATSGPVYAIFDGPTGGSGGGGSGGGGSATVGYGFKFTDGVEMHATYNGKDEATGEFDEYMILGASFTAGKSFQLYDFGQQTGWVIDVDGWSFGGESATDTKWMTYLSKGSTTYTVLQDFTADIYIKLKYQQDNIYFGLK